MRQHRRACAARAGRASPRPARAPRAGPRRGAHHRHGRASGCAPAGIDVRSCCRSSGLIAEHRSRAAGYRWSPCAPTSTRCPSTTHRPALGRPRSTASATPAGTTCTPPSLVGAGLALEAHEAQLPSAARGAAAVPAGRGDHARRRPRGDRRRVRSTASTPSSRLHCDPTLDVGRSACASAPLTGGRRPRHGAADRPRRAHLAPAPDRGPRPSPSARSSPSCPAVLSRRLDPRAGASLVWGEVHAGGRQRHPGERRRRRHPADARRDRLDDADGPRPRLVEHVLAPYGVTGRARATSGACRPWSTTPEATDVLRGPRSTCRARRPSGTAQSLGGEDFAWYLEQVPGAMGRLGTRTPGRADLRPAPGRPAHRRARRSCRRQGCSLRAVVAGVVKHAPDARRLTRRGSVTLSRRHGPKAVAIGVGRGYPHGLVAPWLAPDMRAPRKEAVLRRLTKIAAVMSWQHCAGRVR